MGHKGSRRLAIAALALGIGAFNLACSSGSAGKKVTLGSGTGTTAPTISAAGTPPAASGGTTGAFPSTAAGAPGTTAAHAAGPTATTKPPGPAGTTATTAPRATVPPATGPAPAAPGNYTFNGTGTSMVTFGTTTTPLPVGTETLAVTSTGPGAQQWVGTSTTSNLLFNGTGVFLQAETVFGTTCTFSPAVAYPPWPLASGQPFQGQATCGSGTLYLSGHVAGTASVSVGGTNVSTFLVQSTLKLAGTTLVISETDWYAPSLRLPVKSTVIAVGGSPSYSIASNTTYVLASTHPS
jgi:hypothetical protein